MVSDGVTTRSGRSEFPAVAAIAFRRLPLQLLLRDIGAGMRQPVVLLDHAGPQGIVQDLTPAAVRQGVRLGMTAVQAQLQCAALRSGVVPADHLSSVVEELQQFLLRYSPVVEASVDWPEVCWLDASGLGALQGSLRTWAEQIQQDLWRMHRLQTSIAVGGSRLGTAVLALGRRIVVVLDSPTQEQQAMAQTPLAWLLRSSSDLQLFERLGVQRLAAFSNLREADLAGRVSSETVRIWRMVRLGVEPERNTIRAPVPVEAALEFSEPVVEHEALLFAARRLLPTLLERLREHRQVVERIEYHCELADAGPRQGVLAPATPGRDARLLLDLLRLHWQAQPWPAPVTSLRLRLRGVVEEDKQQTLPTGAAGQRLPKAAQALDRLRAAFGSEAVMVAQLRTAHLPEACVVWRPLQQLGAAQPRQTAVAPLVRRLFRKPRSPERESGRRWRRWGRVLLAGGWWQRWIRRRYYFEGDGRILRWMYDDLMRGERYEQGRVE